MPASAAAPLGFLLRSSPVPWEARLQRALPRDGGLVGGREQMRGPLSIGNCAGLPLCSVALAGLGGP